MKVKYKQMNKLFIIFTLFFAVVVCNRAVGQEQTTVSGQVIDEMNNETLPGVNVIALDKNNRIITGSITNLNGEFVLSLKGSITKLKFTFIGFKDKEVPVTSNNYYKVVMTEDVVAIDAVEVMGEKRTQVGFMNVADRDLAVAIGKISAEEFDDVQAASIDEALQGRLAGVDITSNGGDPGAGMSIRIRGVSTLSANSQPLIVVDNVPFETTVTSDFDFATANEEGYAQMLNISVSDIKEITVLKDAASTAMWGTKAANGVLMITTKRGVKGRKPSVSYTYRGTFTEKPEALPTLNGGEYSTLIQEAYMNRYNYPIVASEYKEILALQTEPYYFHNFGQDTDWMDAISRTGFTNNHDVAISGGGEKAMYRFSVNYQDQQGVTVGTSLERLTTRLNLDYFISDNLRIRADFSYAHGTTDGNYSEKDVVYKTTSIRSTAYRMMPNMSIYEYNAMGERTGNYFSPLRTPQGTFPNMYNPVAMAELGMQNTFNDRIISKFSLNYNITDALKYTVDLSLDVNSNKLKQMLPIEATGVSGTSRYANRMVDRDDDSYNIYTNNMLAYHKEFNDKHKLTATLNLQTNEYIGMGSYLYNTNGVSSALPDASGDGRSNVSGYGGSTSEGNGRNLGMLAMFHYSLMDRYILSAGVRREGNSRFDEKYRWGHFPSISAAWRISGEPMIGHWEFLDDMRLRFSYGENGNPPRYESMFYSNYRTYDFSYLGTTGVYPGNMQLQNLKWESIKSTNVGVSAEMFGGRLSTDIDFYKNRTEDMFAYDVQTPSSSGYSTTPVMNVSTMDNYGWDLQVKTIPFKTKDWMVSFDFNIARNYNILRELADDFSTVVANTPGNGEYKRYAQINNPAGSFYGYRYKGVYTSADQLIARDEKGNQITDPNGNPIYMKYDYGKTNYVFETGDAMYDDINNDGNINTADIVLLGDANPDYFGGFGQRVEYKNFSFNYYFYFRVGNDIINNTKMYGENMNSFDNQTKAVLKRWRKEGDQTDIPRSLLGYGYNWLGSDRFVEDGSFMRLKYVTLAYKLPKKWVAKFGMKSARISTTMNNLFTLTKYSGQDPEISIKSNDGTIYTVGYDDSNTPRTRDITCTLNITF